MKITKQHLTHIIKEELEAIMQEGRSLSDKIDNLIDDIKAEVTLEERDLIFTPKSFRGRGTQVYSGGTGATKAPKAFLKLGSENDTRAVYNYLKEISDKIEKGIVGKNPDVKATFYMLGKNFLLRDIDTKNFRVYFSTAGIMNNVRYL
jgi:phosphohistidine phosphatase SixA